MRSHRLAGLLGAATLATAAALPLPAAHAADTGTRYVDNTNAACTDHGTGTPAQPFCTVQAAADAAQPGDTVSVLRGGYAEAVTIARSGEPGKPITITGPDYLNGLARASVGVGLAHAFVLNGVHDVAIRNFRLFSSAENVLVNGSTGIVIERNQANEAGTASGARLHVSGASKDIRILRNTVVSPSTTGIQVEPGAQATVISTNLLTNGRTPGIQVEGSPGTAVTSNTLGLDCTTGLSLAGDSHGSTVENNVLAPAVSRICTGSTAPAVSVSTVSAPGTVLDYNLVKPLTGSAPYRWADNSYATSAGLLAATGHGQHDLIADPGFDWTGKSPAPDSPLIDSADADAPGELTIDLLGRPRVDDPNVPNTGNGSGAPDRGALELVGLTGLMTYADHPQGPYPLAVTPKVSLQTNWTTAHYTYVTDFGDGTAPVSSDSLPTHVYQAKGRYTFTVTVTDGQGATATAYNYVTVNEPGPLVPAFKAQPTIGGKRYSYLFSTSDSTSSWPISKLHYDFGDGTSADYLPNGLAYHEYESATPVTVKLTVTDDGGRTATTEQLLTPAYPSSTYTPIQPVRLFDTREGHPEQPSVHTLRGGDWLSAPLTPTTPWCINSHETLPREATAVVVNVTAVHPSANGYLTVWADGPGTPATSNLNFKAGQTVANLVTVPLLHDSCPSLRVFNFAGTTDVVADIQGYYTQQNGSRFTALAPTRLLDTRKSHSLGPDEQYVLQAGLPKGTTAAVLNVTAVTPTTGGYLSVTQPWVRHPGTSNINFTAGQTIANQVIVPVAPDGTVAIYNHSGNTHVVADLMGYYSPDRDSLFTPVTPTRLVDTRRPGPQPLGPGATLAVPTHAPAGATGAVLNVTSTGSTNGGYLTVWADGTNRPGTSNLNFTPGQTIPNHVTTPLGSNGSFDVYNFTGRTHVVADLFGYFTKP